MSINLSIKDLAVMLDVLGSTGLPTPFLSLGSGKTQFSR
jgi:hypothetical protein